ncbi:YceI family protein [Actinomadura madurae]|uniref:YceI family protein n=2 Tax=Actinomadura madurae TaxID=1993 RepID=UPI002025F607|nr:YceI family protein [Actinomadura madurae]MCP9952465.1 YceI family protein [Actinomadura madurae]MCP9969222.1 YceI family protein [Actinomadura madurae]MCQ0017904.1 YceI family protein [Actinomadura madurae]URM97982.1 YceI family protein [Actinomadura madurae]URN08672.1 YceI family protein [Actinomadura madurae]
MSIAAVAPELTAGTWNIDPVHSEVTFVIRHLMTKVRGVFTDFTGTVQIAEELSESTATAEIKVASIDTRNPDRDAHMRTAEVLDAEKYPVMTFATKGVRAEGGEYFLDGELTIKDVTRPIALSVEFNGVAEDPWGGTRAGFSAAVSISRKDWGIEFNVPLKGEKALLSDKVDIQLEVQAVRA